MSTTPHVCFADAPQYAASPVLSCRKPSSRRGRSESAVGPAEAVVVVGSGGTTSAAADESDGGGGGVAAGERLHPNGAGSGGGGRERNSSPGSSSSLSPQPHPPHPHHPQQRYERNLGFFQQLSRRFGLRNDDDPVRHSIEEDATSHSSSSTDSCSSSAAALAAANAAAAATQIGGAPKEGAPLQHVSSLEHISCASSETSSTVDMEDQLHQQQQQQQQQHTSARRLDNKGRKSATRSSFSRLHRRSTSSIRRAFESFSLSSRSLSCSGGTPPLPAVGGVAPKVSTAPPCTASIGGTPIKSALKSSSHTELNKRATFFSSHSFSSSTSPASGASTGMCSAHGPAASSGKSSSSKPPPQRILRQPVSYTYLKGISGLPTQRVPRSAVCCQYARR